MTTYEINQTETHVSDDLLQLAEANERRALTYGLLSRLYRVEIDADLLAELRGMRFPASTGNDEADRGYHMIAGYLSHAQGDVLTELAADYVRSFLGAGIDGHAAAYPFESVYTSEKHLLMEDARNQVLAIYRSMGLESADDWKEPEDHIALEFELMKIACDRAAEALRAGDEEAAVKLMTTQLNFAADHLLNWVPQFAHDVEHFAKTDLYRGLAHLTVGFVCEDAEFLKELLADEGDGGEDEVAEA